MRIAGLIWIALMGGPSTLSPVAVRGRELLKFHRGVRLARVDLKQA